MMKIFKSGDMVYVVTPAYLVDSRQRLEAGEPLKVVFDHIKCGLAYVIDAAEMHEIPASVICGVPEGHVFATDVAHSSEEKTCLVCGCHFPKTYVRPVTNEELSLLVREMGSKLQEQHHVYFSELLAALSLSEIEHVGPVPLQVWEGIAQAIANASGYRLTIQAAMLEPVSGDPNQDRIVGYCEVARADPTLFVKPAE